MIMKVLVSSALAVAITASIGPVAAYAKEPAGYRTAAHRLHQEHATRFAGNFHPYASQPYLNVWGSRVYLDRGGY
jgi:hypothetical protein